MFAAVATASVASSTDGITWTARTFPVESGWTSVAYGEGVFAATNDSGAAASSTDGITWTERTLPNGATWRVAYGGGVFTAAAGGVFFGASAASSTDGITWTARTLPVEGIFALWGPIAYGG